MQVEYFGVSCRATTETPRRLSGIQVETSAVFNMATQFGSGKTHALTTLFHLATNGETAKTWKGVDAILKKAEVPQVPKSSVAVFVGTEFDAITGRGGDRQPSRHRPMPSCVHRHSYRTTRTAVAG